MKVVRHETVRADGDQRIAARQGKKVFVRRAVHGSTANCAPAIANVERLQETFVITLGFEHDLFVDTARIAVIPLIDREFFSAICHAGMVSLIYTGVALI